jgi:two-component system, NtrC family, response regulator HydG
MVNATFKILVVDDNRSLAEALSDVFEAKGYEPTLAFDGLQAVEKIKTEHFDCVLMDIKMPGLNGVDAFREIKKFAPAIPVILMTAYSVQGLIDEARAEGALAILSKPVAPDTILTIAEQLKSGSSVLIADSNPDPALLDLLKAKGDRVAVADNVRTAVNMAASEQYDIVLLSADVQGLTSLDSVALLKHVDPKCLIILMKAEPTEEYGPFIFGALQKPFKINDVVSLLEKARARKVQEKLGKRLFDV